MNKQPLKVFLFLPLFSINLLGHSQNTESAKVDPSTYLNDIKIENQNKWPKNRTINLVFHGHSVPSGYFKTPELNTLTPYPALVLKKVKHVYPFAVVNTIVAGIGGENSIQGAKRFDADMLTHQPDILFIDYAINDRRAGFS